MPIGKKMKSKPIILSINLMVQMKLPNEILLTIFQYLSPQDLILRCSFVSQLWNSLTDDNLLWKNLVLPHGKILNYNQKVINYKRIYKKLSQKETIQINCYFLINYELVWVGMACVTKYILGYHLFQSTFDQKYNPNNNEIIYLKDCSIFYNLHGNDHTIIRFTMNSELILLCSHSDIKKYCDQHNYIIQ